MKKVQNLCYMKIKRKTVLEEFSKSREQQLRGNRCLIIEIITQRHHENLHLFQNPSKLDHPQPSPTESYLQEEQVVVLHLQKVNISVFYQINTRKFLTHALPIQLYIFQFTMPET